MNSVDTAYALGSSHAGECVPLDLSAAIRGAAQAALEDAREVLSSPRPDREDLLLMLHAVSASLGKVLEMENPPEGVRAQRSVVAQFPTIAAFLKEPHPAADAA